MMARATVLVIAFASLAGGTAAEAQTLRGSTTAMQRQNRVALQHDYTFLRTSSQVKKFVSSGYLVPVRGNADYELAAVSHPYARPAVKLFIERLSAQYRSACGQKLVVTSLTRPVLEQPRNASDLSVHPAGMAVDLRVPNTSRCRSWLESTLMSLERQGVLDATRENRPPHYHIALFPEPYTSYVAQLGGSTKPSRAVAAAPRPVADTPATTTVAAADRTAVDLDAQTYRVNRGDSLWSIARRYGTTVGLLQELNGLAGTRLTAGQTLKVPVAVAEAEAAPDSR